MPQGTPADHRIGQPRRRRNGRDQERRLVPHPARRMLIDRLLSQAFEIQHLTGIPHRGGQRVQLAQRQPAQKHRHQPCRQLLLGNRLPRGAFHQKANLVPVQLLAVPLLTDQIDRMQRAAHRRPPSGSNRKLHGKISANGRVSGPLSPGKQTTASGVTNSLITCRHAPHGGLAAPFRFATAIARIFRAAPRSLMARNNAFRSAQLVSP